MTTKKLFLVQFLIEADVSDWPDFDERQAADHFREALNLSPEDKVLRLQAYMLARLPDNNGDLTVEEYEDQGFRVEICQNAHTVGTDVPTYFALVWNMQAKTPTGSVVSSDCITIEEAKESARANIEKRIERQRRQDEKRGTI